MTRMFPIRVVALSCLIGCVATEAADACSTCFGDPNSDLVIGAKAGVAVMAVVAYSVLGCVAWIGRGWYIRAKQLADQENDTSTSADE